MRFVLCRARHGNDREKYRLVYYFLFSFAVICLFTFSSQRVDMSISFAIEKPILNDSRFHAHSQMLSAAQTSTYELKSPWQRMHIPHGMQQHFAILI